MFHYCDYWHSWSRLLAEDHFHAPYIEINLTGGDLRKVPQVWVRAHSTPISSHEIHEELPAEVRESLVEMIGEETTNRLLTEDFLPQIDWELYERACNGGAPLGMIRWQFAFSNNPAEMTADELLEYAAFLESRNIYRAKFYFEQALTR